VLPAPWRVPDRQNRLESPRVEVAPHVDHAHGDEDLGMDNALLGQMLHHAPGNEFVVLGIDEPPRDGLESLDEPVKLSKR